MLNHITPRPDYGNILLNSIYSEESISKFCLLLSKKLFFTETLDKSKMKCMIY